MLNRQKQDLLSRFADQSDKLFELGIIRTDSFTGEIGEFVAASHYGLTMTARVTRAIDATDSDGKKYQIKAKVIDSAKISYTIPNLDINEIDFLVIVYFDPFYAPVKILRISSDQLQTDKVSISKKFLDSIIYEELTKDDINIPEEFQNDISDFGKLYNDLRENEIIRSRRIVGDLGEFYASQSLNLTLNENKNEKGVDAYDDQGVKYEIKTRRVYESGRRKSKSRRLNNLVGKDSKFLVVVVLDRKFTCAGMWIMPMRNVSNPKSAHLEIVNTTPEVKNIVKSRVDWLH